MLNKEKPVVIIQARINSQRFHSKILKKIRNLSILEILIKRIKKSKHVKQIIVACVNKKQDKPIIDICKRLKIKFFCGSETNVLERYYLTAKKYNINNITCK